MPHMVKPRFLQFFQSFSRLCVLLLCAAMELDTRFGELCESVRGHPPQRHPSFALAFTLFDQPAWDAMSPERPLRYWRLIEINQPGAQALIGSALKADERIKRVEQLKEEKSLFGKDGTLPKSTEMRFLVTEYRNVATTIKATCEKSFDAAADEYLKKKDLAGAKAVVAEKDAIRAGLLAKQQDPQTKKENRKLKSTRPLERTSYCDGNSSNQHRQKLLRP